MVGWRGKKPEPATRAAPAAPVPDTPDAVATFPRGLPDGDQHKAGAIGRWPSADDVAAVLNEPWRPGLFLLGRDHKGRYFGHDDDRHILTVAGSRAGKGVSLIVPNLLYWPGSVIAIDPKGELATLTASRRSAVGSEWSLPMDPGHGKVFVLDPYGRVTGPATNFRASFNPLADLDPNTERGLDMAWQIADALIIQSSGDGAHWTQSARTFLRGLILYVATVEPPASRTLMRVRALLTLDANEFAAMLEAMTKESELIAQAASAMLAKPPAERMSAAIPVGRIGVPEDIWLGVKFVIECDYFNGRTFDIDGGLGF